MSQTELDATKALPTNKSIFYDFATLPRIFKPFYHNQGTPVSPVQRSRTFYQDVQNWNWAMRSFSGFVTHRYINVKRL